MYPYDLHLFGAAVSIWNAAFAMAVLVGFAVYAVRTREEAGLSLPKLRYVAVVYLSALAAQFFSYAFDAHTTLTPPPDLGFAGYYLNPVAGPKTLYGVIVLMPVSVWIANAGADIPTSRALDLWTPTMFVVLALSRVGCLLQGCCYGTTSALVGLSFPPDSPVYHQQLASGWIQTGAARSLPVVPTQLLEAGFLALTAAWSWSHRKDARPPALFLGAVSAYSVFRFGIEFVRADEARGIYGPLATSQWLALVVFAVAMPLWIRSSATRARPT